MADLALSSGDFADLARLVPGLGARARPARPVPRGRLRPRGGPQFGRRDPRARCSGSAYTAEAADERTGAASRCWTGSAERAAVRRGRGRGRGREPARDGHADDRGRLRRLAGRPVRPPAGPSSSPTSSTPRWSSCTRVGMLGRTDDERRLVRDLGRIGARPRRRDRPRPHGTRWHVSQGDPCSALAAGGAPPIRADLVVVGSRGHRNDAGLPLGSTSHSWPSTRPSRS